MAPPNNEAMIEAMMKALALSAARGIPPANFQFRPQPIVAPNADEFDFNWKQLESALRDIHEKNASGLSFEQLYRYAYKIVLKKAGDRLYENVKQFEERWFTDKVCPRIFDLISRNLVDMTLNDVPGSSVVERRSMGERFLKGIREAWEEHNTSMNMTADILMYLDRGFTQGQNRPTIFAATIGLFRDHILRATIHETNCIVFDIFNATILDQINMEREGDVIDKALLRSCTSMLDSLYRTDEENEDEKLYFEVFEPVFLESSHAFYKNECERLLQEGDAATWLRHTQRRLDEESDRCATTISLTSLPKILAVVEQELISKHLEEFMNLDGSGVRAMIDNDRIEDLKLLYQLVSRIDPKKSALKTALSVRVIELGYEIEKVLAQTDFAVLADEASATNGDKSKNKRNNASAQLTAAAVKWVADVLALKVRFDRLLSDCFADDLTLQTALTKSFAEFINRFDRSAEYLSLYIDHNLKAGVKDKSEAEVELVLEQAITLLRYLEGKDQFETYYQKHLARRLLQQKSSDLEVETEMISRMKRELGNSFTHKFEGMFRDINLSKDMSEAYAKHVRGLGASSHDQIGLAINVLGGNNWPKETVGKYLGSEQTGPGINFPAEIKALQDSFYSFYSKDRTGRKLTWIASAGTAEIRSFFPKVPGEKSGPKSKDRRYELSVPTYGMAILLLFNDLPDGESLSFEEIQERTNIPQTDLINLLTGMSAIKSKRVLWKEPNPSGKTAPGDKFKFNNAFVSPTFKVKLASVNVANQVENDEERKETDERTLESRRHCIEAAVVRIMKQRKELEHQQLVMEVIQQISGQFKPDLSFIKNRITDLIDREYLERFERDGTGRAEYRYLA
ncbi:Cullin family protein [Apiospora marii]|uniref:Cullin family protein n=1 Tax=Apiospora marii TaxID=335849 RepID=A0ABR1S4J7_9PEZI